MSHDLILVLLLVNNLAALWLFCYGINAYWLVWRRHWGTNHIPPMLAEWPLVTVQLPIYNEYYVAQRLLQVVAALDYPRDRLQIQVLDDSKDQTQFLLQDMVTTLKDEGFQVQYLHRQNRKGYKAGALAEGTYQASGEFIAIFDADFLPSSSWLKETLPHFQDPKTGAVQTRWGHINTDYSLLTRLQALGIDGHFNVEQQARSRNNYFLNFNGTAGIWRKQAILEGGNWQSDTLAEDMDLSYRVQLQGWRLQYVNEVVAPAELPVAINAYKLQQCRWAKGSIQCARKLSRSVLWSRRPLQQKIQALLHLTGYAVHPLMVVILLLSWPLLMVEWVPQHPLSIVWGILMVPATFGPPLLYATAQRDLHPNSWIKQLGTVVLLAVLGTGISLSNTRAVFSALFNPTSTFRRTPKFDIRNRSDRWQDKRYVPTFDPVTFGELFLCWYAFQAASLAWELHAYGVLPFLLLYLFGYGYVGGLTLYQQWQQYRQSFTASRV